MKKLSILMMAVLMSGCATTGGLGETVNNMGVSLFKTSVNEKCQSEIKANQYYQMASIIMSDEQKSSIVSKACGCVSDKAPQSVTMTEIATATLDSSQRPAIVGKAVQNTLQACVTEWLQGAK